MLHQSGTVTLTNVSLVNNSARGGIGGVPAGVAYGSGYPGEDGVGSGGGFLVHDPSKTRAYTLAGIQAYGNQASSDPLCSITDSASKLQHSGGLCDATDSVAASPRILVAVTPEPAGDKCENGGKKIEQGLDDNGNRVLDAGEVRVTSYACHPSGDNPAESALVNVKPATVAECPQGGVVIEVGVDRDRDGVLSAEEITSTEKVCNGADGIDGAAGADGSDGADGADGIDGADGANGADGADGIDGATGADGIDGIDGATGADGIDGANGADGIDGATGADGADGRDGKTTLMSTVRADASVCPSGGSVVNSGADINGNNRLDDQEITSTMTICASACSVSGEEDGRATITCTDGSTATIGTAEDTGCSTAGVNASLLLFGLFALPALRRRRRRDV